MATLTISHYVYLNREQRYDIHDLKPVEVIGVSVPVWFNNGNTSEPAKEVFCKLFCIENMISCQFCRVVDVFKK